MKSTPDVWKAIGRCMATGAAAAVLLCCNDAREARRAADVRSIGLELEMTSADELVIGRAVAIIGDSSGRSFVADRQAQLIHVLDASGNAVRTIGRRGDGPGEFRDLTAISWLGDTLVALDAGARRLQFFDSAGHHLASLPWPVPPGRHARYVPSYPAILVGGGGRVATRGRPVFLSKDTAGVPPDLRPTDYYAVLASDGSAEFHQATDTLPPNGGFDCEAPDGSIAIFQALFPDAGPWRAFDGDAIIATSPTSDSIVFVDLRASTRRAVAAHNHAAVPIMDPMWDSITRPYRERERAAGSLSCDLGSMRPQTVPRVTAIVADAEGRIWLEGPSDAGYVLDVFARDGELMGEGMAPARDMSVPFQVAGNRLYVVIRDADDVQRVQVYRVSLRARQR